MFVFYAVYFLFRFFNSNQTTATMGKKRLKRDAKGRFLKEHSKKRRGTKRRRKRSRKSKRKNQKGVNDDLHYYSLQNAIKSSNNNCSE